MTVTRCKWCANDPLLTSYHDTEWGRRKTTNEQLFEALTLEVFQSGLSWRTVLHKRERFNHVFAGFSPAKVALFNEGDIKRLLGDPGIIRHRQKIEATVNNAKTIQGLIAEFDSFRKWLDQFGEDQELKMRELRTKFRHVGPTTAESFLEAIGEWQPNHDPTCQLKQWSS